MDKKLMERIWHELRLEIPLYTFRKMQETKTSFKELNEMLEDFKDLRNKYLGYNLGNSMHEISYQGTFPFHVIDGMFSIWDCSDRSLGHFKIDINEIPSNEFIKWVEERVKDSCNGFVHCSDCDKKLPVVDIAGRYFAGIYCKDCWEHHGWKEKEAKETYN